MSQFSGFWTTTGAGSGDQVSGYTQSHWSTAAKILSACNGFEGVAPNYLNSLAGTVTGANHVQIDTGGGLADGKWYNNSAAEDITIISAVGGGNTRIDRIVLRCNWAGFVCGLYLIGGTDAGSPSAPAITQTPGTTYDIMLYQALVNTGGTVTLTDERVMAGQLVARQGGSATNWSVTGANNYIPNSLKIQTGVTSVSILNGHSAASTSVTFPVAFSDVPIVMVSMRDPLTGGVTVSGGTRWPKPAIGAVVNYAVNVYLDITDDVNNTGATWTADVYWLAIGPV